MLHINPNVVPFALTVDNKVPLSNRLNEYWDESGDVLLITKDEIAVLSQMTPLLECSATVQSSLGHISKLPQVDRWMPTIVLACNATHLKNVLEYLKNKEQKIQLTVDELARYAISAYTFCIDILDEAALTGLLKCTRERLDDYAHWGGTTEFHPPPVTPDRTILASRSLPEPASSMLSVAFVDGSVFGLDEAALHPDIDVPAPGFSRAHDQDTIALLRERNSELMDSLLKLCSNFDERRSLSKAGRPCCNFKAFAAYHAHNVPDTRVNAAAKGRSALSIIATLGAKLEEARLRQGLVRMSTGEKSMSPFEHVGEAGCLGCLEELHQGMRRLYGVWWEDMGRLLMGEPKGRHSAWDDVRSSLLVPQPARWGKLWRCLLIGMYLAIVGLLFRQ